AYDRLLSAIPDLDIQLCQHETSRSSSLKLLSKRVFTADKGGSRGAESGVEWLKARSIDQEVREALRWIKAAHRRQSLPLRDCALVLTDPEGYEPYVRQAAREYGIPLLFGGGKRLDQAPAIVALFDLLDLPLSNWPRRLTLEAIRSPFFDLTAFNLDPADAIPLEAASYWGQVVEGLDQWEQTLHTLAQRKQEASPEPLEVSSVPLPSPEQALRMNQGLRQLGARLSVRQVQTLTEWVTWLEDLLQDLMFFERAESSEEEAAALRLREVFRAMMLSEAVVGGSEIGYQAFLSDLNGSLERVRYQPRIDWQKSALQVEGIQAVRGLRFEAVAMLGLSEGQLPVVEREDPFLGEALRQQLGLEPRIGRDQASLFYEGITRADGSLLFTRPTLSEDGETWEPSPFWQESLRVFGMSDDDVPLLQSGADRPMSQAASPQEVAFLAVRRGSLPAAYEILAPRLEPLRQARTLIEARLAEVPSGVFEGGLQGAADELSDRYDEAHIWSPSRLESYGTCPHFFLTAQLFGLEQLEEPALGPDVRQLGSLLHRILELAYEQAPDPTDPDQVLDSLRPLAKKAFDAAPSEFGFRPSPLWQVESEQLTADLEDTVLALAELEQGWEPMAFEAIFGLADTPPLVMETEAGSVRIRGVIDRVDRKGDQVRVIDYKTGSSHLDPADLVRGRRLQLPLYALAAERALKLGRVSDGFYWVIRSAKPGGLRLGRFSTSWNETSIEGPEGSYQVLRAHLSNYLNSIRAGEYPPVPPQGGCPIYCPAADWCWRYSPGYQR
ncbi:MAG: PD-(D/E)XK nuclease family protein, partial [Anaerolineales bacterium]